MQERDLLFSAVFESDSNFLVDLVQGKAIVSWTLSNYVNVVKYKSISISFIYKEVNTVAERIALHPFFLAFIDGDSLPLGLGTVIRNDWIPLLAKEREPD